ncbi:MAG TPA: acyltransferase [Spirochaetota bacterium]|nr:acyltransferase [Spirochaetota bacterium]
MKKIIKKRNNAKKIQGIIYKIINKFSDSLARFLIDMFRYNSFSIGYAVRWACYKKLCKHIGDNVVFEPCSFIYSLEFLSIGENVVIHPNTYINCGKIEISIGDNVAMASGCFLVANNHNFSKYNKTTGRRVGGNVYRPIVIKNNAWLGVGCIVLGGAVIGEGAVVGAGSLVNKELSSYCIYGGVPAKKIKKIRIEYV